MNDEIKRIVFKSSKMPTKKIQKKKAVKDNQELIELLKDYVEVNESYLKFLYGQWVKLVSKKSGNYRAGGFITKIEDNYVYLRSPHNTESIIVAIADYHFYCKESTENYYAIQEILMEKQKLTIEKTQLSRQRRILEQERMLLNQSKNDFKEERSFILDIKERFEKLTLAGKIQIL